MSLPPFMKKNRVAGLIIAHRTPDGPKESHQEGDENSPLEAAAEDLLRGFNNKDPKQIAMAIRAAFEILESEPHEEMAMDESEQS